jgi:hypothetical protein
MFATLSPITTDIDIKYENYDSEKPKRKRQRLDHLSQEEKLMRRKLKNRMAAQSARDRKKVKMQDLEEEVALIAKERNALLNENSALRLKNSALERENKELMRRISVLSQKSSIEVQEVSESCGWSDSFESAELIYGPQQKEQVTHPSHRSLQTIVRPLMTLFVYWSLIKTLTIFSMYFTCIQKNCSIQLILVSKNQKSMSIMTPMMTLMNSKKCLLRTKHHNWNQLKT